MVPKAKPWHEYLLMLVNRGSIPAATFVALSLIGRLLPEAEFAQFLLIWSLSQWFLAFGYQWQKNIAFRMYFYQGFDRVSLVFLGLVTLIVSGAYLSISHWLHGDWMVGGLLYTVLAGALYYVSTLYRVGGSVPFFANIDTLFQTLRWAGAVTFVLLVFTADAAFWGMAAVICVPVLLFLVVTKRQEPSGPRLAWQHYFAIGLWMAVFDFAGSGMMYIDRFHVQDAGYILHSTVGNQIGSVLFGAFMATAYPRITRAWKDGTDPWRELLRAIKLAIPLLGLTIVLCILAGPVLLHLLAPAEPVDWLVLTLHGLSIGLHYMISIAAIVFVIAGRNYVPALLYLLFMLAYAAMLYATDVSDWTSVALLRSACLSACLFVVAALAIFKLRLMPDLAQRA